MTITDFMGIQPEQDVDGLTAQAQGEAPEDGPATAEAVVEKLREVFDPEIPVNIYDLGLIYELDVAENGRVDIIMSLTAPGCPVAGEMPKMAADAAAKAGGVSSAHVALTFEPAWTPERMSEDAKLALGFD